MSQKILIVDDSSVERDSLKRFLESHEYEVTTATDAMEAMWSILKEKPNYIILDIVMPAMSGLQLCKKLKQEEETKDIKIVLYSGQIADIEEHFKNFGAEACLLKIGGHEQLLETLRSLE